MNDPPTSNFPPFYLSFSLFSSYPYSHFCGTEKWQQCIKVAKKEQLLPFRKLAKMLAASYTWESI